MKWKMFIQAFSEIFYKLTHINKKCKYEIVWFFLDWVMINPKNESYISDYRQYTAHFL